MAEYFHPRATSKNVSVDRSFPIFRRGFYRKRMASTKCEQMKPKINRRKWLGHIIRRSVGGTKREPHWTGIHSEPKRGGKQKATWKRTVVDEAMEAEKQCTIVKALEPNRKWWWQFVDPLCSIAFINSVCCDWLKRLFSIMSEIEKKQLVEVGHCLLVSS